VTAGNMFSVSKILMLHDLLMNSDHKPKTRPVWPSLLGLCLAIISAVMVSGPFLCPALRLLLLLLLLHDLYSADRVGGTGVARWRTWL